VTISNVPVLLFLIPFVAALIVAAIGFLVPGVARWIAVAALGATVAVAISAVPHVLTAGSLHSHIGGWPPPIGIEVLLDPLSAFIAVVVSVVAFIVVVGGMPLVTAELPRRETAFYASMLLLMSGLLGIVITNDMFNLFVQIEVASLAAYALVAAGGR
jgi:multicomponent Na+:H+ antiporter subunit D